MECGSLHENGHHRPLNTWPPVSGTVWEELQGVALLEEVWHCEANCGVSRGSFSAYLQTKM